MCGRCIARLADVDNVRWTVEVGRQAELQLQLELDATEGCLLAVETRNRRMLSHALSKQKREKEPKLFLQQLPMAFTLKMSPESR